MIIIFSLLSLIFIDKFKRGWILRAVPMGWLKADVFGGLTWPDGKHYIRSPIVVATAAS
jgi:hypothetical protein